MIWDLKLRNFSETTIHTYTRILEDFAGFFHHSPERLGPEEVREYLLHGVDEKSLPGALVRSIGPLSSSSTRRR
jgi:hypothetical protein